MHLSGESLLIILVVGLIAGWLAGQIVQGTGFGIVGDLLIGIVGALIGSWLLPQFGIRLGSGIVAGSDEIYDIKLSGAGSARHADVQIANRAFWNLKTQRRQMAGTSGCGLCGVEAVEQALPELQVLPGAALPPTSGRSRSDDLS